jgi:GNAT superfamily N-acetyltransferase
MNQRAQTIILAFDGSVTDAEGLQAVERATFDESPYGVEQIRTMLASGPQRAWLAFAADQVVGFAIAFPTYSLSGPCWEIDLLAVLPRWRGHGLATRLIRAAAAFGKDMAPKARAVVAMDNSASAHAFTRAGFQTEPEDHQLLIARVKGLSPRPNPVVDVAVQETDNPLAAADWLDELTADCGTRDLVLLLATHEGRPAGHAELIAVQTLLYCGFWIESLTAPTRIARRALVHAALERAKAQGLDEVGMMVPERDRALLLTLLAAGFQSLGTFRWLSATLPLPGLAAGSHG